MSSPVLPMIGELGVREVGGAVEVGAEAAQEAGTSDAPGQCRDAHAQQSCSRLRTGARGPPVRALAHL